MSVSSEWLIITANFLTGQHHRILPELLKKYEDSLSNFDPSTTTKKNKNEKWSRMQIQMCTFLAFLLTYHVVAAVSAFESARRDMSHHLT